MSFIHTRKLIGTQINYAGRSWWYHFEMIPEFFQEQNVKKFSERKLKKISNITKQWDKARNSEWTVRIYLAAKMALGASIFAQNLQYSRSKNLRAVISYLEYYTIFYSLRAILLTNPNIDWNNGKLLLYSHSKVINSTKNILSGLDKEKATDTYNSIKHLKALRELQSYRAPSSGDHYQKPNFNAIYHSRLFLEIAQLQSELFELSILKNVDDSFEYSLDSNFIKQAFKFEIEGITFFDKEDAYRIGYFSRKYPMPTNILHTLSEGHIEDYFGSWCSEDSSDEDMFDPDLDCSIVFNLE